MVKHLTKHGDQVVLVFDAEMLKQLDIALDTPLEVTAEGRRLTISPVDQIGDEKFKKAFGHVKNKYKKAFERLAK